MNMGGFMKTKSIKKYAVTALIILAVVAVFALLFWGLSSLIRGGNKGEVVAEYDGNLVYEEDVVDIINYYLVTQVTSQTDEDGLSEIMKNAIKTYVRMKTVEMDLAEQGYYIDEKVLNDEYKASIEIIEEDMKYKDWYESYRVSKNFLKEELRRYAIASLYHEVYANEVTVTDAEIQKYYQTHAISDYLKSAGYYWTSVIRPVKDVTDEAELAEAKAEMEAYIEKVKNGTMTLEEVNTELDAKYNNENGYSAYAYDGSDVTAVSDMLSFIDEDDFNDLMTVLDEMYADRDATADKSSDEYSQYMTYLGKVFQSSVYYAIQNLEPGEVWDVPLQSFLGYYMIRFDSVETNDAFVPFDEVKEEIRSTLETEKFNELYEAYLQGLEDKYDVVFYLS